MKTFNASAAISKGWEITKNNLGLLVVMTIIVMLIPTIGQTILKTCLTGLHLA